MAVQRRKHYREPVVIRVSVATRTQPFGEAAVVNLSEGGVKLRTAAQDSVAGAASAAGEEIALRFALPESGQMLDIAGTVVWITVDVCGALFRYIPEGPGGVAAVPDVLGGAVGVDNLRTCSGSRRLVEHHRDKEEREKQKGPL